MGAGHARSMPFQLRSDLKHFASICVFELLSRFACIISFRILLFLNIITERTCAVEIAPSVCHIKY